MEGGQGSSAFWHMSHSAKCLALHPKLKSKSVTLGEKVSVDVCPPQIAVVIVEGINQCLVSSVRVRVRRWLMQNGLQLCVTSQIISGH